MPSGKPGTNQPTGETISFYLSKEVCDNLRSRFNEGVRSNAVDLILREKLGIPARPDPLSWLKENGDA